MFDLSNINAFAYRKPTFTDLGTNCLSFILRIFKTNVVKLYYVDSLPLLQSGSFSTEINFLINFFINNCYSRYLIGNCISRLLNQGIQQSAQLKRLPHIT